jgi:hypothetical protein
MPIFDISHYVAATAQRLMRSPTSDAPLIIDSRMVDWTTVDQPPNFGLDGTARPSVPASEVRSSSAR